MKTDTKLVTEEVTDKVIEPQRRAEKISAAMKAFLKRAKEHGNFKSEIPLMLNHKSRGKSQRSLGSDI